MADRSSKVWTDAEIKIGRELAKMPKAKGSGSNQHKDRKVPILPPSTSLVSACPIKFAGADNRSIGSP
jgi:hypothetical protein